MSERTPAERVAYEQQLRYDLIAVIHRSVSSTVDPRKGAEYAVNALIFHEPGRSLVLRLAETMRPPAEPPGVTQPEPPPAAGWICDVCDYRCALRGGAVRANDDPLCWRTPGDTTQPEPPERAG